jgi:3-hydroxyacyl-[acyl-carrier-protein] dehydratase
MSFILVDEIVDFKPGVSITAAKDTAGLENYYVNHVLHGTIVPPTLVAEAVAQAAGWLITASLDFKKRGLLIDLGMLEFTGLVFPFDQLLLEAELISLRDDAAMLTGRASVDGKLVGKVDSGMCILVDADGLDDVANTRATFAALCRKQQVGTPR